MKPKSVAAQSPEVADVSWGGGPGVRGASERGSRGVPDRKYPRPSQAAPGASLGLAQGV